MAAPLTLEECDEALALLRVAARTGEVEWRELARLAIDDVLDARNLIVLEQSRMGAQS